jgi:hypothetical protein
MAAAGSSHGVVTTPAEREQMGLPAHVKAKRKCLACGATFDSAHQHNRLCDRCKALTRG